MVQTYRVNRGTVIFNERWPVGWCGPAFARAADNLKRVVAEFTEREDLRPS